MILRHAPATAIILAAAALATVPSARAQEAEPARPEVHQEGIAAQPMPATNAITRTEDTPVVEQDETIGGAVGDGFDVDVIRETPDPDPQATIVPGAETALEAPEPPEAYRGEVIGPRAGGGTGAARIFAEELKDYTVHLTDAEDFGRVARLIVNLETGQLEGLIISTGGLLGVGDERYEIPFDQVAAIDTATKEMRVAISREMILPQDQAFDVDR